ncbi:MULTISPECIES: GltB/FmdC/FwdC-like GXGXG domain-containing protein [Roseicyclus]|uniref:GltB/FmdC/FwdC-like GXGXG domain-containing protein n=1 Tax=Roseicyclus amphidinii TaxID=3034232 RepID=UPI0024E08203|nr:protein GlxC [Roseicyclus sp. Amp-Y-6]
MTMTLTNTGLIDLSDTTVREANATLQAATEGAFTLANPGGKHALACGLQHPVSVTIKGHTGYYAGGMNKLAEITIEGNAGTGLAENIMSGVVRVTGDASQSAGATGHGGLVVIEGNASARCGISMKGVDIVVGGNVGHMSAFMAQAGNLVVLGDAGPDLGDSIYEAQIFVRGSVDRLGTDCIEKEMRPEHIALVAQLMDRAGLYADPAEFRRYGSARQLYHFKIDNAGAY